VKIEAMRALIAATVVLILFGCARPPTERTPGPQGPTEAPAEPVEGRGPGELVRSEVARVTSPDVGQDELTTRVAGNNAFAFDLYQIVREEKENAFYSPHSIALALAMAYAGARGETEEEMAETLRYTLSQDRLHAAFNALALHLASRDAEPEEESEKRFRLVVANSIWGQSGYSFLQEYLDVLTRNYGLGLRLLDFSQAPEEARQAINTWVSDRTSGQIQNLIPQGIINTMTRLILTNAIYFRASWKYPFDDGNTTDGTFRLLSGEGINTLVMEQTQQFDYAEGEGYQAVELPYVGEDVSMVIIAPELEQFGAFEANLDADRVDSVLENLERTNVTLRMPKFEFGSDFQLSKTLRDMGMPAAFSAEEADLSGIDGTQRLFIRDVLHKGFVSVDEMGTEAAASTAVVIEEESVPPTPIEVTIDSPFIFVIRDAETGAVLFVGRVLDPASRRSVTRTSETLERRTIHTLDERRGFWGVSQSTMETVVLRRT
jgi:serpin B